MCFSVDWMWLSDVGRINTSFSSSFSSGLSRPYLVMMMAALMAGENLLIGWSTWRGPFFNGRLLVLRRLRSFIGVRVTNCIIVSSSLSSCMAGLAGYSKIHFLLFFFLQRTSSFLGPWEKRAFSEGTEIPRPRALSLPARTHARTKVLTWNRKRRK